MAVDEGSVGDTVVVAAGAAVTGVVEGESGGALGGSEAGRALAAARVVSPGPASDCNLLRMGQNVPGQPTSAAGASTRKPTTIASSADLRGPCNADYNEP